MVYPNYTTYIRNAVYDAHGNVIKPGEVSDKPFKEEKIAMTDTNYNDGEWHGHNSGECPVHPKTEVEVALVSSTGTAEARRVARPAGDIMWGIEPLTVVAFRVTKEHKEPREFWIVGDIWVENKIDAIRFADGEVEVIHVREIIGDDT